MSWGVIIRLLVAIAVVLTWRPIGSPAAFSQASSELDFHVEAVKFISNPPSSKVVRAVAFTLVGSSLPNDLDIVAHAGTEITRECQILEGQSTKARLRVSCQLAGQKADAVKNIPFAVTVAWS
jgi:hypothetical protein